MGALEKATFFTLWLLLWVTGSCLFFLNIKWGETSFSGSIQFTFLALAASVLMIDVTEGLAVTLMTMLFMGKDRLQPRGDPSHLRAVLNYNLLANSEDEISECYETMYKAFMGNLTGNMSAVLLSATSKEELKKYEIDCRDRYRLRIYRELVNEGIFFLSGNDKFVDKFRLVHLWRKIESELGMEQISLKLIPLCLKLSKEFMCIHRVTRVLKKCGQYQDLMLLSEGYWEAFTYCDKGLYGSFARKAGEPMFHDSEDVRRIFGRKYTHTIVLDSDTEVRTGSAYDLLTIAVMHPDKGLIQPAIAAKLDDSWTLFMYVEKIRSAFGIPVCRVMSRVLEQGGFYGKAMMNNKIYIEEIIGHPGQLIEKVPVDVLSHDTYEAAILRPYPVTCVTFYEDPPTNYVTWDIRLRRWSIGDLMLAMHFHRRLIGAPLTALQKLVRGKKYENIRPRSRIEFNDFLTSYICNSAIRQFLVKPIWFLFSLPYTPDSGLPMHHPWQPFLLVLLILCAVSKVPLLMRCTYDIVFIIPEVVASTLQYTGEIVVGSMRFIYVVIAVVRGKASWVPQRTLEERFKTRNLFKILGFCFQHLYGYTVASLLCMGVITYCDIEEIYDPLTFSLLLFLLAVIAFLPIFCFVTAIKIHNPRLQTI